MKIHGMKVSKAQLISRQKARIHDVEELVSDLAGYLQWLEEQPDDYTEQMGPAPAPPTKYLSVLQVVGILETLLKVNEARRVTDSTLRVGLSCLPGVDRYYDGKLEAYAMQDREIKKIIEQTRKENPS